MKLYTADEIRQRLRNECRLAGSQAAWAAMAGVTAQYVADVLKGRRDAGLSIAGALGFERRVVWLKIWDKALDEPKKEA